MGGFQVARPEGEYSQEARRLFPIHLVVDDDFSSRCHPLNILRLQPTTCRVDIAEPDWQRHVQGNIGPDGDRYALYQAVRPARLAPLKNQ